MYILCLLEVLKTPSERALIWSTAKALQQFIVMQLHILLLHFNREKHLSVEVSLFLLWKWSSSFPRSQYILQRLCLFKNSNFVMFCDTGKKIHQTHAVHGCNDAVSVLSTTVLCKIATMSEICPLPCAHICREEQVLQCLRSLQDNRKWWLAF